MKKLVLLSALLLTCLSVNSQSLDWAKSTSGSNDQMVYGAAEDQSGNVYSAGEFWGLTDFDPGVGSFNLSSQGSADIFVQKFDINGNLLWAIGLGSSGPDRATAIDVDQNGNTYITGSFSGTIDFDPGAGTNALTTGGYSDVFVLKLDANGNFVWAKNFQSLVDFSTGNDIKVDATGNVYTTGKLKGTIDFDPGPGTNTITGPGSDIFVHKLTANGDLDWVRTYGGSGQWVEEGQSIEMDAEGDLYISGIFMSTVDFDAGLGTTNVTAAGTYPNVFVLKLKPDANFVWAKGYGSTSNIFPSGADMAINGSDLFVVGAYTGTVDFDPGVGVQTYTGEGSRDIYIQKLDTAGNFQWAKSIGNPSTERGISIAADYFSNSYVTGVFSGTLDFDPDPVAVNELIAEGNLDVFVLKLDDNGEFDWVFPLGSNGLDQGNTIISDQFGTTIWTAGSFSGTVDFDPTGVTNAISSAGISDGFIQKINQVVGCLPTFGQLSPVVCNGETYNSPSGNYSWNQTGAYSDTLINTNGCDSILTIDLTVLSPIIGQTSVSICSGDTYQSPSGNYSWNQAGMFTDTISSAAGCDSVISIDLSVISIDNSVVQQDNVLNANQTGATYQWVDCDANNTFIPGETNAAYTALMNGNYAVEITLQNCTVTSICYEVNSIGIDELYYFNAKIYPNPTSGQLTIELAEDSKEFELRILNPLGQMIGSVFFFEKIDIQLPGERGVYFLHFSNDEREGIIRVIKQ